MYNKKFSWQEYCIVGMNISINNMVDKNNIGNNIAIKNMADKNIVIKNIIDRKHIW